MKMLCKVRRNPKDFVIIHDTGVYSSSLLVSLVLPPTSHFVPRLNKENTPQGSCWETNDDDAINTNPVSVDSKFFSYLRIVDARLTRKKN